jgi:hypothetical protein
LRSIPQDTSRSAKGGESSTFSELTFQVAIFRAPEPMLLRVPLIAYVHAPSSGEPRRPPWDPDWRIWRPATGAVVAAIAAAQLDGVAALVLILIAFGLACRALDAALPYRDGLREWRQ